MISALDFKSSRAVQVRQGGGEGLKRKKSEHLTEVVFTNRTHTMTTMNKQLMSNRSLIRDN